MARRSFNPTEIIEADGTSGAPRCRPPRPSTIFSITSSDQSRNTRSSADEHVQTTGPNMASATPSARQRSGGEAARRVARVGRAAIRSRHPSSRGRSTEGLCPGPGAASSHPDTDAASGPEPGTWKDPDPRRRSSRGSGGSEWACVRGNSGYATPAACPVSTLPGAMVSGAHAVMQPAGHVGLDPHGQTRPWLALLAVTYR